MRAPWLSRLSEPQDHIAIALAGSAQRIAGSAQRSQAGKCLTVDGEPDAAPSSI
jgi:hypothetical protein